ncbi:MAG: BofC C-terminal domain-containing protein [Clostridia bacterium]|nr:BofC C-terminal domain-containing protein [Clostridia bacterium]
MNFNRKAVFAAILITTTFFSSMIGYIQGVRGEKSRSRYLYERVSVTPQREDISSVSNKKNELPVKKAEESIPKYILKEQDGILALYLGTGREEKLWQTYDISVNLLPESDRAQLAEGIEFSSISEALQMIEDFSG